LLAEVNGLSGAGNCDKSDVSCRAFHAHKRVRSLPQGLHESGALSATNAAASTVSTLAATYNEVMRVVPDHLRQANVIIVYESFSTRPVQRWLDMVACMVTAVQHQAALVSPFVA
jgi:hypothetical protein